MNHFRSLDGSEPGAEMDGHLLGAPGVRPGGGEFPRVS